MTDPRNLVLYSIPTYQKYGNIEYSEYVSNVVNSEKTIRISEDNSLNSNMTKVEINYNNTFDFITLKLNLFESTFEDYLSTCDEVYSYVDIKSDIFNSLFNVLEIMSNSFTGILLYYNPVTSTTTVYDYNDYSTFDDNMKSKLYFTIEDTSIKVYPFNTTKIIYNAYKYSVTIKQGQCGLFDPKQIDFSINNWIDNASYTEIINFVGYIIYMIVSSYNHVKNIMANEETNPITKVQQYNSNRNTLENKINILQNNSKAISSFKELVIYAKNELDILYNYKVEVLNKLSTKANIVQLGNSSNIYLSEELYSINELLNDGHTYLSQYIIHDKTTQKYNKKYKLYIKSGDIYLHEFGSTFI